MGSIGVPEMIIIFIVALIVFGPKKLPELGKSLGKGLAEFRRASNELKATIEEEVRSIETETNKPLEYSGPHAGTPNPYPASDSKPETKSDS